MYIDNRLDQGKSIISDRRAKSRELHGGAEDGYEDAVMDSSSDSDIPLAKIIQGSRTTPIISSDSNIPLPKITRGSRATAIFSSDSDIPLTIPNLERPFLAKYATAGGNLF